jgi:HD-GYP domain-containing protein (c-di-GMP phosphodiesterase class II)
MSSAAPAKRPLVPLRVNVYAWCVVALALALAPLSIRSSGMSHGILALFEAAILGALMAVASRNPVQIGPKRKISIAMAPQMAAVMLLPGPIAVATVVAGGLMHRSRRPPLVQHFFNAAVRTTQAALATLVYASLARLHPATLFQSLGAVLSAPVLVFSSTILVAGIAGLQLRENPWHRAWASQRDTVVAEMTLCLTGMMAALATAPHAWALPLLVAPAAIAHYALRDGVALRAQTRLAMEDLADIVDMRDHYTFEHSRRVAELARATAGELGLPRSDIELITMAGRVHDVGKIGIKSSVLMKPGRLTDP